MNEYIFSEELAASLRLAANRMKLGFGATLFLEGLPGGGKTSFARALASELGGDCYYYSGSPDKERNLLYEIDVEGVLQRKAAWVPGPCWEAFEASTQGRFSVLLIDEIDKTSPGFDSFLLRLLEEWTFRSPSGDEVKADPTKMAVVITTNGRRAIRPEVLRRCHRVQVPLPSGERLEKIIQQIAGCNIPKNLLEVAIRIGNAIRKADKEQAPSPKELAMLCIDALCLAQEDCHDSAVWRAMATGWLVKEGGVSVIDNATKYRWTRALMAEANRA